MVKTRVATGIWWVEIPEADLRILCGCPADAVKHLMKRGFISESARDGVRYQTGPNAILLSDVPIQNGSFANLAEFPVLQMLYLQGMILPKHPNNTGVRPILIGLEDQVRSQSEYILRGNYGLVSEEELITCGLSPEDAQTIMRVKRWFAFGSFRRTEELLDMKVVDNSAIELRPGVFIHRTGLNHYSILSGGESVDIDLGLGHTEDYEAPYELGSSGIRREYFSVVHTGEGDGWDTTRPSMGSIVCHQGRLYLVDAGPNIVHSLTALGISVYEIEGVFQTHAHDDHFAGLTSLIRSDHRLAFYAAPYVRLCVQRKLAALMAMDEKLFHRLFDVHDLAPGAWNDVQGMEVRPLYSPHPVETTVLFFRVWWGGRYLSYAHLADLPSREVLGRMVTRDATKDGIAPEARDSFLREILAPLDLKKIDSGGGMIHGAAEDFAGDRSGKVILSHRSTPLNDAQKEIGSSAAFGLADVLTATHSRSYLLRSAHRYLRTYFPGVPEHEIALLTNCAVVTFNPGSIMIKKDARTTSLYLVLSGVADFIDHGARLRNRMSSGALIGETAGFLDQENRHTFRAVSPVTALDIPCDLYRYFVRRNGLYESILRIQDNRTFLFHTPLFGELVSFHIQSMVARTMQERTAERGRTAEPGDKPEICILAQGVMALHAAGRRLETLGPVDFWGESHAVAGLPPVWEARAETDCRFYAIPVEALKDIPIVQWKLVEVHNRRMRAFRAQFRFVWMDFYRLGIQHVDEQHRRLFELIDGLAGLVERKDLAEATRHARALLDFAIQHFNDEETLLQRHQYPRVKAQHTAHTALIDTLRTLTEGAEAPLDPQAVSDFFKDWLINHTLLEDRKYQAHLARRGVS